MLNHVSDFSTDSEGLIRWLSNAEIAGTWFTVIKLENKQKKKKKIKCEPFLNILSLRILCIAQELHFGF